MDICIRRGPAMKLCASIDIVIIISKVKIDFIQISQFCECIDSKDQWTAIIRCGDVNCIFHPFLLFEIKLSNIFITATKGVRGSSSLGVTTSTADGKNIIVFKKRSREVLIPTPFL